MNHMKIWVEKCDLSPCAARTSYLPMVEICGFQRLAVVKQRCGTIGCQMRDDKRLGCIQKVVFKRDTALQCSLSLSLSLYLSTNIFVSVRLSMIDKHNVFANSEVV